jgi:hypothetical protein
MRSINERVVDALTDLTSKKFVFSPDVQDIIKVSWDVDDPRHVENFMKTWIFAQAEKMENGDFGDIDPLLVGMMKKYGAQGGRDVYGIFNHGRDKIVLYYDENDNIMYVLTFGEFLYKYKNKWGVKTDPDEDDKVSSSVNVPNQQRTLGQRYELRRYYNGLEGAESGELISYSDFLKKKMKELGYDQTEDEYKDRLEQLLPIVAGHEDDPYLEKLVNAAKKYRDIINDIDDRTPGWKKEYERFANNFKSANNDNALREAEHIYPHNDYSSVIQELMNKGQWDRVRQLAATSKIPIYKILVKIADLQASHKNTVDAVNRVASLIDAPYFTMSDSKKAKLDDSETPKENDEISAAFKARYEKMIK